MPSESPLPSGSPLLIYDQSQYGQMLTDQTLGLSADVALMIGVALAIAVGISVLFIGARFALKALGLVKGK